MKKLKARESYDYPLKIKLTLDDIHEIYTIFKEIDENSTIQVNNWELEDISELTKITEPIEMIDISTSLFNNPKYPTTYTRIYLNRISLYLNDSDDVVLLGLKTKFEAIINNRQHPVKKPSILDKPAPQQAPNTSPNQNTSSEQVITQKFGLFEKYKGIIEGIIVGIILLAIAIIIRYYFKIGA